MLSIIIIILGIIMMGKAYFEMGKASFEKNHTFHGKFLTCLCVKGAVAICVCVEIFVLFASAWV